MAADASGLPFDLGSASSFGVLAGSGITNTGSTSIDGDLGTFPTTTITGAGSLTTSGVNHAGDTTTQAAKLDLATAYASAAAAGPATPIVADLGGQSLFPGVYNSASSIGLTGPLTLNGAGDPGATFVFQAASTLTTASTSQVDLINGAQACNVFWQVGSSATLGTGSSLSGTVIAMTSITVTTGTTVDGRILALAGAVTLDADTVSVPSCTTPTTTTTSPLVAIGGPKGGKAPTQSVGGSSVTTTRPPTTPAATSTHPPALTTTPSVSTTSPSAVGTPLPARKSPAPKLRCQSLTNPVSQHTPGALARIGYPVLAAARTAPRSEAGTALCGVAGVNAMWPIFYGSLVLLGGASIFTVSRLRRRRLLR